MTYNAQHLPLTITDAAGQTTTYTYNERGQVLTKTNPTKRCTDNNHLLAYDDNGYRTSVDGPIARDDSMDITYDLLAGFGPRPMKVDTR